MTKSQLHARAESRADGTWYSLPPHKPGKCYGVSGGACPGGPDEPCGHKHATYRPALVCSRNREPFA